MSYDAEWIDVDQEFGVPTTPRRRPTTDRPFWATTRFTPRFPTISDTPPVSHDAPEQALPQPLDNNNALVFGLVGAVLGLLIVGLLVYMLVLRKRLSKVQASNRPVESPSPAAVQNDYSLRVADITHLSTSLDDSTQLYVNTSDLYKLVSSAKAKRKNPPSEIPSSGFSRDRPGCPAPLGGGDTVRKLEPTMRVKNAASAAASAISRLSGKFSAIEFKMPDNWKIRRSANLETRGNDGLQPSLPDIVRIGAPEDLEEDDIWSEDSFDSFSIGYEDESTLSCSRGTSSRGSSRPAQSEASNKVMTKHDNKKFCHPSMPPPPPPVSVLGIPALPSHLVRPSDINNSGHFSVARHAPSPPVGRNSVRKNSNTEALMHQTGSASEEESPIKGSSKFRPMLPPTSKFSIENRPLPELPNQPKPSKPHTTSAKRDATAVSKPSLPSAPKPSLKPNVLPKLKMGLPIPPKGCVSVEATPDTTTTLVLSTPVLPPPAQYGNEESYRTDEVKEYQDPSKLSVSARRALLEGKGIKTKGDRKI